MPGVDVLVLSWHRPVDQVEVGVVQAEAVEALAEGAPRLIAGVPIVPQLRRDEEFPARHTAGSDGATDLGLVLVRGRCVDVPIADLERLRHEALGVLARDEVGADAELRDGLTGVELDAGSAGAHAGSTSV